MISETICRLEAAALGTACLKRGRYGGASGGAPCRHGTVRLGVSLTMGSSRSRSQVSQHTPSGVHSDYGGSSFEEMYRDCSRDVRWDGITSRYKSREVCSPLNSLNEGRWVKLICGASFEDIADVRNLSLIYTLAGVDCIDCAADSAIVSAVNEGIAAAMHVLESLQNSAGSAARRPWVMISINDDEDPHFRKAEFDSRSCPANCPRPCERICPAIAIRFEEMEKEASQYLEGGVIAERCYGCGRCLSVCPLDLISATSYQRPVETISHLLCSEDVDALEIHTGAGRVERFEHLVKRLGSALGSLQLVAVSVPDLKESMIPALNSMYRSLQPFIRTSNLWQLDGRPMSGDIGAGATRAAVTLATKVCESKDRPPGYIQLAGGTNAHTATALKNAGLYGNVQREPNGGPREDNAKYIRAPVAGVAYGGYARKLVQKFLTKSEGMTPMQLELHPSLLADAVLEACSLVDGIKSGQ